MGKRITQMPKGARPRDKLLNKGAAALSDVELVAVLLGSGTRTYDVFTVACRILRALDQSGTHPDVKELLQPESLLQPGRT